MSRRQSGDGYPERPRITTETLLEAMVVAGGDREILRQKIGKAMADGRLPKYMAPKAG